MGLDPGTVHDFELSVTLTIMWGYLDSCSVDARPVKAVMMPKLGGNNAAHTSATPLRHPRTPGFLPLPPPYLRLRLTRSGGGGRWASRSGTAVTLAYYLTEGRTSTCTRIRCLGWWAGFDGATRGGHQQPVLGVKCIRGWRGMTLRRSLGAK